MNRPPLTRFLDVSAERRSDGESHADTESPVATFLFEIRQVLVDIVDRVGVDQVCEQTGLSRTRIEGFRERSGQAPCGPMDDFTLAEATAILACESPYQAPEIRSRISDHLIVRFGRASTDVESVIATYGFEDSKQLRAKISGDADLTLREYARLRVALG